MEKLIIEVDLTNDQLGIFNAFISEYGINYSIFTKKYILQAIEKHESEKRLKKAMGKEGEF